MELKINYGVNGLNYGGIKSLLSGQSNRPILQCINYYDGGLVFTNSHQLIKIHDERQKVEGCLNVITLKFEHGTYPDTNYLLELAKKEATMKVTDIVVTLDGGMQLLKVNDRYVFDYKKVIDVLKSLNVKAKDYIDFIKQFKTRTDDTPHLYYNDDVIEVLILGLRTKKEGY